MLAVIGTLETVMYIFFTLVTTFFALYQSIVSLCGMWRKDKEIDYTIPPNKKFAVIVCAHNEDAVIGKLIESLLRMDYPKKLYDVHVVADNCKDYTATICRDMGVFVWERFSITQKGKGYALEWIFAKLWKMEEKYDAIIVFDADNIVSPNFLKLMNDKLTKGYEVIQAYLDTKNPKDTWVTRAYAFSYWTTNRVYQMARKNLGLSAQLGGTGMCIASSVLQEIGWGATSLTEDLEFTAKYILKSGRRVAWVHDAKILDEKPLKIRESFVQRTRWMKGHVNCLLKFAWPLFKNVFSKNAFKSFDMLIYLAQPIVVVMSAFEVIFFLLSLLHIFPKIHWMNIWVGWTLLGIVTVSYMIPVVGALADRKWRIHWAFVGYVYALTWIPIMFVAIAKRKEHKWNHTKHTRAISADTLNM